MHYLLGMSFTGQNESDHL